MATGDLALGQEQGSTSAQKRVVNDFSINVATVNGSGSQSANSVLLKFSRSAESQADLMGSHLMAEAGYNPVEMARFFEKLNTQGGRQAPQFFSDHPNPDNREKAIEQEITRLPAQNYTFQTGDFERMKQLVSKMREPKPPAPAQVQ